MTSGPDPRADDPQPSTFGSSTQPALLTAEPALDVLWHRTLTQLRYQMDRYTFRIAFAKGGSHLCT